MNDVPAENREVILFLCDIEDAWVDVKKCLEGLGCEVLLAKSNEEVTSLSTERMQFGYHIRYDILDEIDFVWLTSPMVRSELSRVPVIYLQCR
jgi:hypothetical protein